MHARPRSGEDVLTPIAGNIPDISWDCIARKAGPKLFDQFAAFLLGNLEMGRPGNSVELVQIVGHDSEGDESLKQGFQHVGVVVHSPKKNGLLSTGMPASTSRLIAPATAPSISFG